MPTTEIFDSKLKKNVKVSNPYGTRAKQLYKQSRLKKQLQQAHHRLVHGLTKPTENIQKIATSKNLDMSFETRCMRYNNYVSNMKRLLNL